jgi:tetratricopeptide (TPR) repeat protein
MKRAFLLVAMLAVAPAAFGAEVVAPGEPSPDPDLNNPAYTYQVCLQLSRKQPDKAIEMAGKWIGLGGGEAAKHCQALALVGLKEWGEGALRLEELARESKQGSSVRANMLAQAGHAWVLQGELSRAYAAQTTAIQIIPQGTPQHVELLLDRAGTLAEAGEYDDALKDVTAALKIQPNNPQIMAFRASANRLRGNLEEAMADAERAVALGPQNVAALLERGNMYRMERRLDDARKDWLRILEIDPDSAEGDAARANIERIDVDFRARVKD